MGPHLYEVPAARDSNVANGKLWYRTPRTIRQNVATIHNNDVEIFVVGSDGICNGLR